MSSLFSLSFFSGAMKLENCGDDKTEASADLCSFSCKSKDSSIDVAMHLDHD